MATNETHHPAPAFANVYDLARLPEWQPNRDGPAMPGELPRWSGHGPMAVPPAIGTRVHVRINDFGPGEVLSYFTEHGFLGVKVRPDVRPAWHRKQTTHNYCLVYGIELEAIDETTGVL